MNLEAIFELISGQDVLVGPVLIYRDDFLTCQKKEPAMPENVTKLSVPSGKAKTSFDAKRARLEALDYLRESFKPDSGQFVKGFSDASIAKDTGLAVGAVAALREEWFGPLREPDELAELRSDIKAAKDMIAALETKLAALVKTNGWS